MDADVVFKGDLCLFWGGWPSQWAPSPFTIDGLDYNCCEQYMMAQKALLFNDSDRFDKIMKSDSPKGQKEHGRRVENFDKDTWDGVKTLIVFRGNFAKFSQNEFYRERLLATGVHTMVEASPYDKVWGIGRGVDYPFVTDRSMWLGMNLLGEVLTTVRMVIRHLPIQSAR